jgi:hypothetical protein
MEPPGRSLADGVRHSCGGRKWTARELLRDQWFITKGPEILQEGEGATAGARQKHCPGRCCADAATACQKSWGCIEEDDGHISFSSGPHVVITAVPQERFGQGCMRSRRLQAHAGPDDRHWQTSGIPGIPGIVCSFASFTPPPAMVSMSSQYPRPPSDVCSSCLLPGRVQYRANCITRILLPSRQITAYATAAICGVLLDGRPYSQPYVLISGTAWREASQRAAFRYALPLAGGKRCHLSTQLRRIFFTAR